MLNITLHEGEYFMVGGNVKITYDHSRGKNQVYISVDAPREVQVLRGELYENDVAERAASGDQAAIERRGQILADYESRAAKAAQKASQAEHARKVLAGEITPKNEHDRKMARAAAKAAV